MKKKVDLHMHTTASDGEDSPRKLVLVAQERRVELISITDHDSLGALAEAALEAQSRNIGFINGVELSVVFRHRLYHNGGRDVELHLLGYRFDAQNQPLSSALEEFGAYRVWRAAEITKRVNAVLSREGKPLVSHAEFDRLKKSVEGSLGRPHLARLLITKGIVATKQEAFDKYLVSCDVPKKQLSLQAGTALIRDAGGLAVLAHPYGDDNFSLKKITEDIRQHAEIIESMKSHIDGVECYYWNHTAAQARIYVEIAKGLKMAVTAGSDHHGGLERDRLGRIDVPSEIVDDIFSRFTVAV
ncbi:MAG: PHP domain-containing protein [Deltaproteobacteria bacterium]|nr:PHP domain-containing protein [Deltaproteobacteria bacterium]